MSEHELTLISQHIDVIFWMQLTMNTIFSFALIALFRKKP